MNAHTQTGTYMVSTRLTDLKLRGADGHNWRKPGNNFYFRWKIIFSGQRATSAFLLGLKNFSWRCLLDFLKVKFKQKLLDR